MFSSLKYFPCLFIKRKVLGFLVHTTNGTIPQQFVINEASTSTNTPQNTSGHEVLAAG